MGDLNHDGKVSQDIVKTEWFPAVGISETPENRGRVHSYAECSNAGTCDRNTGVCNCYDGYDGSSCQRKTCPTNNNNTICSGHGECISASYKLTKDNNPYFSWEVNKVYSCKCDSGFTGLECSLRECPIGIDAVTSQPPVMRAYFIVYDTANLDSLDDEKFVDGLDCSYYRFSFTYDGATYVSNEIAYRSFDGYEPGDDIIREYINELAVVIRQIEPLKTAKVDYITEYNEIVIEVDNLDVKLWNEASIQSECFVDTFFERSLPEQYMCGNHGNCNTDTGKCECFKGYTGPACDSYIQTVI